jgi:hypothetical protein
VTFTPLLATVGQAAALDWAHLKMKPDFGSKKLRELVALFILASGGR